MNVYVPSFESSLYLNDPQSVIAYTLRKYARTPKDTIPILPDLIISLRWRISEYGRQPDLLVTSIQSDLQNTFDRIFAATRTVTVSVFHTMTSSVTYDITITVTYVSVTGDVNQTGTTITLVDGELKIPEDTLRTSLT